MSTYFNQHARFKKLTKKKLLLSNELKKAIFMAFVEAKKRKVYITSELLLYGLISQSDSLAAKLILRTISEFQNNKNITSSLIGNKILELYDQEFGGKSNVEGYTLKTISSKLLDENGITPWLSPEVREIFRESLRFSTQTKKKVIVVSSKYVLFELINKEPIREKLTRLIL